ncbi:MAG: DUF2330 domain-containing protein [Planctomycetales bacterium]|nr:DUF2330 domain-containing protein [Planctomycetales bacterium]
MRRHLQTVLLSVIPVACFIVTAAAPTPACCPVGPQGQPVVNADQTVVILWDPETKTEHFIRQASFKSDAADFAFLIPTPNEPELAESGNEAFPFLAKVTAPEIQRVPRHSEGVGCGCSSEVKKAAIKAEAPDVTVLSEKKVAGFNAHVLEATSAAALIAWLKDHGYECSPEVEVWVKPYIEKGWKITALKVAKEEGQKEERQLGAAALRLSFKTDRPLFPYREPDPAKAAAALDAKQRLLRIFFVSDKRVQGELTKESPWTGTVAWSDKLPTEKRDELLKHLALPDSTGPKEYWLTEFEDIWPYKVAPADLYFAADASQETVKRPPQILYVDSRGKMDATLLGFLALAITPWAWQRWRRWNGR